MDKYERHGLALYVSFVAMVIIASVIFLGGLFFYQDTLVNVASATSKMLGGHVDSFGSSVLLWLLVSVSAGGLVYAFTRVILTLKYREKTQ